MYKGQAYLMGQAYLDMLSNVLAVSLKDVPLLNKQYFKLITIREDEVSFVKGGTSASDRWYFTLDPQIVTLNSLDNKVVEPTASLENLRDYDVEDGILRLRKDPTDPQHNGIPLPGYARRSLDVAIGGYLDDSTLATAGTTWGSLGVYKGDLVRLVEIGPDGGQTKLGDYPIVLVRDRQLCVSADTVLPTTTNPVNFVVLRQPANYQVLYENHAEMAMGSSANLFHTRIDQGSVVVYAKAMDGSDVVEGRDYVVDYEAGVVIPIKAFAAFSNFNISYTWRQEMYPTTGSLPPRYSTTGVITNAATVRVLQIALWSPDAQIDRRTMANNFGSFIGSNEASTEAYRAFLRGIFQLYWMGPVLERIESALNVLLGFPVIRDDGEVLLGYDTSSPDFNRVTTQRPVTNEVVTYDFPKGTPLIDAVTDAANYGVFTFAAFDTLTTALTVTDYIQDPTWWHNVTIPRELFGLNVDPEAVTPLRRTANPLHVKHVVGAEDNPKVGDPGLYVGSDENGTIPPTGNTVYRHRMAFVLMDRMLKYHTFIVRFDPSVFTANGTKFARSVDDMNDLVLSAKPAHTYCFAQPSTYFRDTMIGADADYYQPQRYVGADADSPEIFTDPSQMPSGQPYAQLGLFMKPMVGSPQGQDDKFLFADGPLIVNPSTWRAGDWFHYESQTQSTGFPTANTPVTIAGAPAAPRRSKFVRVYVNGAIGGKKLVENVDYSVDYVNRTVTRLTTWDSTTSIGVGYVQLSILNETDGTPDRTVGDMPLTVGNIDPAAIRAAYDPTATDWNGTVQPVNNHRDMSIVDRALVISIT